MGQMLESTFIDILNMSITASVIIAAVCGVRFLFSRIPKIYIYLLWSVVLFRLLCPFSFESNISVLENFQNEASVDGRMEYIPRDIGYQLEPEVRLPIKAVNNYVNEALPKGDVAASVNPLQIWLLIGAFIWLTGMAAMLSYSAFALYRLRKQLKNAVWERDNIYRFPGNHSPFVYGLFGTCIYLPENLEGTELEYVLMHEQIHIKRGDPFYRMLAYVALCIHWFNPLVWLAFSLSGKDMEISCDEAVIKRLGNDVKKDYSASLLNLACGDKIVKGIPVAFGESDTASRIKHILKFKYPAKILIRLAVIYCLLQALNFIANPKPVTTDEPANTAGILNPAEPEDGSYGISILSIDKEMSCIEKYAAETSSEEQSALFFADDCKYFENTSMSKAELESISYEEFSNYFEENNEKIYIPATVVFEEGLIVEVRLHSSYADYGISYQPYSAEYWSWNVMDEFLDELQGEERSRTSVYSTLRNELRADLSERDGEELIEVYTGNFLVTYPCGHVEFKSFDGATTIHSEFAFNEKEGWNNVYLGEADGSHYILQMYIRDDGESGSYEYQVFRLDRARDKVKQPIVGQQVTPDEVLQIAGSKFEWGGTYIYDDALFKQWVTELEYYLEHSTLLLSSQNGELRTEQVCELDKYNYETLKRE